MKILDKIDEYLAEQDKKNDSKYKELFAKLAKKYGTTPEGVNELPDDKKKAFFNELDRSYKAKNETD